MMNNNSPDISIIVPVFNKVKYIKQCIESIICQTFKNFELILINDGSTDGSGEICDEFAEKDNRIVVIHQSNKGVSVARNVGLNISRGLYIGWVDADDWIEPDMYEYLFNLIKRYKADIAECNYYMVNGDSFIKSGNCKGVVAGGGYFMIDQYINKCVFEGLCNKLIYIKLFDGFIFPPGQVFEDMRCVLHFCLQNPVYVRSEVPKYYYRRTLNSIITQPFNRESSKTNILLLKDQINMINESNRVIDIKKKRLKNSIIESSLGRYLTMRTNEDIVIRKVHSKIYRKYFKYNVFKCLLSSRHSIQMKIAYILDKFNMIFIYIFIKNQLKNYNGKLSVSTLSKLFFFLKDYKTCKKIIVFESDDWGSIRMPLFNSFNDLEKKGLDLRSADAERYNLNDTLATYDDLMELFGVLTEFKDSVGNHPVFTAISVVSNPDFEKIKKSGFTEYFYEPFTDTLKRYPGCERSFELWKEGIEKRIFIPQFHGREHLNVITWMKALRKGDKHTVLAFEEGLWGFVHVDYPFVDFQAAFLPDEPADINNYENIIVEGLNLFEQLFGYRAEYFVPPNGQFSNKLNRILVENGIKYRCTSKLQHEPLGNNKYRKRIHWLGQKDKSGLRYITRNCFFEPSKQGKDWVDSCLYDISVAFQWHKPAIISTHRVNYIGALRPENRDRGLKQLKTLLKEILKKWPDVEFLTTPQLGSLMEK